MPTKTHPRESRFERDRDAINNPREWPQLRLPMKNPGRYNSDKPSLGWLFTGYEWPSDERVVHVGNIFDKDSPDVEVYSDTEAMLDAGWTVD
jgi:hypothetical protein